MNEITSVFIQHTRYETRLQILRFYLALQTLMEVFLIQNYKSTSNSIGFTFAFTRF